MSGQPLRLVYRSERVRVFQASAAQLLATLPDGSIDLLLTDPPYTTVDRRSGSGHLGDWFAAGLSWPQIGTLLALARRKLKPSGLVMVMTNAAGLDAAIGAAKAAGFTEVRPITWDKRWPGLGGGLRHQIEFVLACRTASSRSLSGTDLVSVAAVGPGTADRYPTMKPDGLGRVLARMAATGPGSLVVDPFCGSAALLVGSAEHGATVVAGDVAGRAVKLAARKLGAVAGKSTGPRAAGQAASRQRAKSGPGRSTQPGRPARSDPARPARTRRPAKRTRSPGPRRAVKPRKPTGSRPGSQR